MQNQKQAYISVLDAKNVRIPHLFLRGEKFYVKVMQRGKWYIRALPQQARQEAAQEARKFVRMIHEGRWDDAALCRSREAQAWATVGEICDAYEAAGAARNDPRARTRRNNVLALEKVLKDGLGVNGARAVSAQSLTGDVPQKFARVFLAEADPDGMESRRRSVLSYMRQAASVFAVRSDFKGLRLPADLDEFCEARPVRAQKYVYRMPDPALYTPTIAAARALPADSALLAAWLCCYELGLRASEAVALRWDWIIVGRRVGHATDRWVHVCNRPDFRTKGREGYVPVPAQVWAALQAFAGGEYVLPGSSPTDRRNLVGREFAAWLRGQGWTETDKCAHELRKLRGSFWRGRYGLEMAHEWLRHSSYQTTLDYYASLPTQDEPMTLDV